MKKEFGERLKDLRIENGLTQEEVAEYLKKHDFDSRSDKSTISRYESKGVKPKRFITVEALARLFGVHVNYLTGHSNSRYGEDQNCKEVPIIGTIAAGVPILAQEDILGQEYIMPNEAIDFCLKIKGDSMTGAGIYDGAIVFVRRQNQVENGEVAVVIVDEDEATLKRFYQIDGTIFLRAENPSFEEIVIRKKDKKNVTVVGKAMYYKSEVK